MAVWTAISVSDCVYIESRCGRESWTTILNVLTLALVFPGQALMAFHLQFLFDLDRDLESQYHQSRSFPLPCSCIRTFGRELA